MRAGNKIMHCDSEIRCIMHGLYIFDATGCRITTEKYFVLLERAHVYKEYKTMFHRKEVETSFIFHNSSMNLFLSFHPLVLRRVRSARF